MIARAASLPLPRRERRRGRADAGDDLSICRPTPMTPVEATSTCSGAQPSAAAASAAIRSASAMPSSPVQALAQPLLTTTARAMPPLRCEMPLRHEHRRRLRQVRGEQRRGRTRRVGGEHRQVERAGLRLDAAVHARPSVKPAGAVTPPATRRHR